MNEELEVRKRQFPTWVRVRLGTHSSIAELVVELDLSGVGTFSQGNLNVLPMSAERDIELVAPTVRGLGFSKPTKYHRICARGYELGLRTVLEDVPLYVALQAGRQVSQGQLFTFVMGSIGDCASRDYVSALYRHPRRGLELYAFLGNPHDRLNSDCRVVFART